MDWETLWKQINAGTFNGCSVTLANGCTKMCKVCNVNYYSDPNHNKGCEKNEEIVKMVLWTCCKKKEDLS